MLKVKTWEKGRAFAKTVDTVLCKHYFDLGKSLETAWCVMKNLLWHNKRFNPELNPSKNQGWMLE